MAALGSQDLNGGVVDASMAASWFLPDEADGDTKVHAQRAERKPPLTPVLFRHEMRGLFVMAIRLKRGGREELVRSLNYRSRK